MLRVVTRALSCVAVVLVVVGLVGGCAGYKVEENGTGCGYDVYAPEPYLLASPTELTGTKTFTYTFSVVWLPNYSKRYRVHSWAGLGKAGFQFTFTDGWKLTAITDNSDNTAITTALSSLAQQLLPTDPWKRDGVAGTERAEAAELEHFKPVLFRIDFDKDGRPSCLTRLTERTLPCPAESGAFPLHPPCASR